MRAMPKGEAPVSRDVVEQAKRRVPPKPLGPPPSGMANFKAPKQYAPMNEDRNRYDDDRNRYDDDDGNYDDENNNNGPHNNNNDYEDNYRHNRNDQYDDEEDDRSFRYNYNRDPNERYNDEFGSPEPSPIRNKYERNEFRQNFDEEENGYDGNNNNHNQGNNNPYDRNNYANDEEEEDQDDAFYDKHAEEFGVEDRAEPKNARPGVKADAKQQQQVKPADAKSIPVVNATCEALLANLHNTSINNQSPGKIVLYNYQSILRATYRELKHFVTSPCTYGITTRCYIERNRSGSHMFAPYYSICADLEGT